MHPSNLSYLSKEKDSVSSDCFNNYFVYTNWHKLSLCHVWFLSEWLLPVQIPENICCCPKGDCMVKPGKAVALVTMDGKNNVIFFLKPSSTCHTVKCTPALFNLPLYVFLYSLMFLVFCLLFPTGQYALCMPYMTSCKALWTCGLDDILKDNYWHATLLI